MGMDFTFMHLERRELKEKGYLRKPYHLASTIYAYVEKSDNFKDDYCTGNYINAFGEWPLVQEDLIAIKELALRYEHEEWANQWGYGEDIKMKCLDLLDEMIKFTVDDWIMVSWG